LGEVDVKRLMYLAYLVDRELYYLCGFTLFPWRFVYSGLRSYDVYDIADELVDLGYFDKEVKDWGSSRVDLQACKLGTGRRFTTS
jgi:hypothetical protein